MSTLPLKKCYRTQPDAFPLEYLAQLKQEVLNSPYLASDQLSEKFSLTKSFSIAFKTSGIAQIEANFPYLKPYLQSVLKSACNAFYLNPVVLEGSSFVGEHVDCSLSSYPKEFLTPRLVSVLYVEIPTDLQGGQLLIRDGESEPWHITPKKNMLVHFLGWLLHSVTPVQSCHQRISLICEQYNLPEEQLAKIPEFEVEIESSNSRISKPY